jgi:ferredoxin
MVSFASSSKIVLRVIYPYMPDPKDRVKENVSGPFYVDSACIDCDVCRDLAPENFRRSFQHAYSFVSKQPENETERGACEEALTCCPVEAIGDDG